MLMGAGGTDVVRPSTAVGVGGCFDDALPSILEDVKVVVVVMLSTETLTGGSRKRSAC